MLEKQGCSVEDLTVPVSIKNRVKLQDEERAVVLSLRDRGLVTGVALEHGGYPELTSAGREWLKEQG